MIITLGFTRSDRTADYIPTMDGYRAGAQQTVATLRLRPDLGAAVTVPQDLTGIQWAHAMFYATNIPAEAGQDTPAVAAIRHALEVEPPAFWQSMSIGDTITVNGETWACGRGSSWELVRKDDAR